MCSEFWNGWFDSWGGHHHTTDVAETARNIAGYRAALDERGLGWATP